MKNSYLVKAVYILFLSSMVLQSKAQFPVDLKNALQDTLNDIAFSYGAQGVSVAVSYHDENIWEETYGNSFSNQPLTSDMLIGIGSSTKTYVSTVLIGLQEAGKLDLDDTIGTWVSGFPNIAGDITIRQVLQHKSGLSDYTTNGGFWDVVNTNLAKLWTKTEIMANFIESPDFAPGTSWNYSNTNYIVAGYIIEQVLGYPVEDVIRDSILTPLQLQNTYFFPQEIPTQNNIAHFWSDIDEDGQLDDMGDWNTTSSVIPRKLHSIANSAGAIIATAEDNVIFWKSLLEGNIISSTILDNEMLSNMHGINGSFTNTYGLGVFGNEYFGQWVYSHGGSHVGQTCANVADRNNNIYISVLSNQDGDAGTFTDEIMKALYKICLDYVPLSVKDLANDQLKVYPNPSKNVINLSLPDEHSISSLRLVGTNGQIIQNISIDKKSNVFTLPLDHLSTGQYFVQVNDTKGSTFTSSFVKQ